MWITTSLPARITLRRMAIVYAVCSVLILIDQVHSLIRPISYTSVYNHKLPVIKRNQLGSSKLFNDDYLDKETILYEYERINKRPFKVDYSLDQELSKMIELDVARGDNYWETTRAQIKKQRSLTTQQNDLQKKVELDKNFYDLMEIGFNRRLLSSQQLEYGSEYDNNNNKNVKNFGNDIRTQLMQCARLTSNHLELSSTKDEQLKELKRIRLLKRTGFIKLLPQSLHKYVDYLNSLRKNPTKGELVRNMLVSLVFSMITTMNARARMAFIYSFLGNAAIMSILLTRNMPKVNVPMGMDRNKVVTWSDNTFKTAVGVTAFFSLSSTIVFTSLLSLLNGLTLVQKLRTAMALSVLSTGYFTSFFEVFEEKDKNGWRWKRSVEGILPDDVQSKLKEQVFGDGDVPLYDTYQFEYNPQIDEYPPMPKYIDEVEKAVEVTGTDVAAGSGDYDEAESKEQYEKWSAARKDARKAPILDAQPEDKWMGGKAGMYVKNVPAWITNAYKKNVLKANKWREKPAKYEKDTSGDVKPILGPIGFRDKRPDWLDMFGSGVWEEKLTTSRKAARAFGTYRKTMFKIDKKVQLLPCDGADKEE